MSAHAKPVLKWVGGKTQLLDQILPLLGKAETYYEPFIGGGAVFLAMKGRYLHSQINDFNVSITDLYRAIRDFPDSLMVAVDEISTGGFTQENYLAVRASDPREVFKSAARTLWLNKTCFNGLYRVNRDGNFNVPWNKNPSPTVYDRENLLRVSAALQNTRISEGDFERAVSTASEGDVVYMDPPYVPASATSSFTSYTSKGFTLEDQKRVVAVAKRLSEKGVRVVISNSDTELTRKLYEDFNVIGVSARRNVNSKGGARGPVGEVLACLNLPKEAFPALSGRKI